MILPHNWPDNNVIKMLISRRTIVVYIIDGTGKSVFKLRESFVI